MNSIRGASKKKKDGKHRCVSLKCNPNEALGSFLLLLFKDFFFFFYFKGLKITFGDQKLFLEKY